MQLPKCDREDCFAYFKDMKCSGRCSALRENNFPLRNDCPFYKSKEKWQKQELNSKSMRQYSEERGILFRDRTLSCYTINEQKDKKEDEKATNAPETNVEAL